MRQVVTNTKGKHLSEVYQDSHLTAILELKEKQI